MKEEWLLVVPPAFAPAVFDALGEKAGAFRDNGGEPDGWGDYLAPARLFTDEEIARACDAGAYVARGWAVEYRGGSPETPWHWCGYSSLGVAYALTPGTARAIEALRGREDKYE